ncbi:ATP-grasp domain-containing protein [Flammeovirga agarivorans]|uniref:ATPase n=1 Tax=Flammeovirga agarivorans TaxID=2726742 RepID=A0A7X8SLF5_9BACT|nr:ATPase [Flammeovirga agarivorans]NLR92302.1 ATPase [Flammeovirga agarivorans]
MKNSNRPLSILCVSCYFKGEDFLRGAKDTGAKVTLLTVKDLEHQPWPHEAIDEMIYCGQSPADWNYEHVIKGLAYKFREEPFDVIVALDDFDVEKAAYLREHFRIGGMGQTTVRHFRDKLGMRLKAQDANIDIPKFTALFSNEEINQYLDEVEGPWLIKPRSEASASGIKKVNTRDEFWNHVHSLGDERDEFLAEAFRPGDVYHVDSLSLNGEVIFTRAHRYMNTPMEVAHDGGVFRTHTLSHRAKETKELLQLNKELLSTFGLKHGASHSEFIKDHATGKFIFLETASRVGGANIAEMLEASSNINLWKEWAKIEYAVATDTEYKLPKVKNEYSGIIVSLAKQEWPDLHSYNENEVVWRMNKKHHAGVVVNHKKQDRVIELLEQYASRFYQDFFATMPSTRDRPAI